MRSYQASYHVKATSRAVTRRRYKRLSWFIIGTAFGIGCTSSLTPLFHSDPVITVEAPAVIEQTVAEAPAPVVDAPVAEVALIIPEKKEPASQYPLSLDLKVASGDTLLTMLTDAGVDQDEAYAALETIKKQYDPKKMAVGQTVKVELDKAPGATHPDIQFISMPISQIASLEISRDKDNSFNVKKIEAPLERKLAHAGGKIDSSLYKTGYDLGLSTNMIGEIINAYSYDVDFQRDLQRGDSIDVLYERLETKEGKTAGVGNLIFSELNLGDRTLKIYRYSDKSGNVDYYNEAGESIRKALLRTPVNGARITSGFGMRNHPVLGYSRMHRGVDFGAPVGTPIYAAGDGTVEYVGKKSGYGNFLKLKHNGKYSSGYAHLSRFASGIAPGKKVKQGQIVAYVGMTGMTTGPHLHYEIFANGEQVNPSGVKFKTGTVLKGKELAAFKSTIDKIEARLATIQRGSSDVAMADFEKEIAAN